MKSFRMISIALWVLVALMVVAIWFRSRGGPPELTIGRSFQDVLWEHLPDVPRFELTDQQGSTLASESLDGRPYAVSFFFASCPDICRDLNRQIQRLNEQLSGVDLAFVSITVDPERDTPDVLARYAEDFGAVPPRWYFLTGALHRIRELGEHVFRVEVIDKAYHTDNLLLVDKWGRYRDRFKWDDAWDMKRFVEVAREVAAEPAPPLHQPVTTRNMLAGVAPRDWETVPWIREFHLTQADGSPFYSRDLGGQVWIASFFFTSCTGICLPQNQYLAALRERLGDRAVKLVSITTDPQNDTPARLLDYARRLRADAAQWVFCTGDERLIRRIGSEYFRASTSGDHHSSRLFVVDRWGRVRGDFDWQQPEEEVRMIALIDALLAESAPRTIVPVRQPRGDDEGGVADAEESP